MSDVKIVPAICLIFYLEVTTKLVILAHYADYGLLPTVTKMILHPKEAWHNTYKSQTCSNSICWKEAKSGIIQHKMVSHLRLFIRPQPERSAAEADADCTDTPK
jgi:hypothetical protein